MKKVLIVTAFSLLLCLSCKNRAMDDSRKVTIYDYTIWYSDLDRIDLRDSMVVYIDTLILDNEKNVVFADSVFDTYYYYASYSIKRDSFFLDGLYCPNLDTLKLEYEGNTIELIKSYYDIDNCADEESEIYWNLDYGLIAEYNYPWGALILYDREILKGFAKETFYDYIIQAERESLKKSDE